MKKLTPKVEKDALLEEYYDEEYDDELDVGVSFKGKESPQAKPLQSKKMSIVVDGSPQKNVFIQPKAPS
jgi:hypothetical protein